MRHGSEFLSGDLTKDSRSGPGAAGRSSPFRSSAAIAPSACSSASIPTPSSATPSLGPSLVLALRAFLEPSAIALDNALALQKAEALSVTDDLTRLYNSRYLNLVLRRETKRAVRSGRPLSLLFLDLDGFKQVNDKHGHLAGSKALVEAPPSSEAVRGKPTWWPGSAATNSRWSCPTPARGRHVGGRPASATACVRRDS